MLLDAGAGNFAFHADAFGRRTQDYRVPSYPYLTAPDEAELPFATQPGAFNKRQPNSWTRSDEASVGGSYHFRRRLCRHRVHASTNNLYGIPGPEGEGTRGRIDARQDKVIGKGEFRPASSVIDAIRFWWGYTDYKHNEIALADPVDLVDRRHPPDLHQQGSGRPRRSPARAVQSALRGADHRDRRAGRPPEADRCRATIRPARSTVCSIRTRTSASPATSSTSSGSATRPRRRSPAASSVSISTASTPSFIPEIFDVAADPASVGAATQRDLTFTPKSISAGLIQNLPGQSRRQRHRAICRARAEAGRAVLARAA